MTIKQIKGKLLLLIIMIAPVVTANAQNLNKPNKMGPMGTQVNTFTGNLFISRNDIYIPARGFGLNISFSYNSFNYEQNNGFGNGWSFGYSIKYKNDTVGSKTIVWGDGREDNYTVLAGGFRSPKGFFNTFTQYQPGKYLLTESGGIKFYFDNSTHKRITKMEEPNGNYINFNYTDTLLTSLVNTAGQSISFTYNSNGNLATVVDAIAAPTRTYTYTYEGNGNLKQVTDPLGGTNKYSYLVNGPMKTMTDKNNNTIDIIYYNDFSISEIIGCNKRVSFSYDTATNITIVTDHLTTSNNQVTKYGYKKIEDQVWLTSITGNCCGYNLSFEYDDNGNKIKEIDANGGIYNYTYDLRGNILSIKNPLNQLMTYTYSSNYNKITSYTDPRGNVHTLTYDANGNLTQLTEPLGLNYIAVYNANGDIISSTDPKGNTYTYTYDAYGNPSAVTGPNGYHATLVNDARGNLLSYIDAAGNSLTAQYDILNRLKQLTDPYNKTLNVNYDAEGNALTLLNKRNEIFTYGYDASNRIVQLTDPTGKKSLFGYDGMDNVTKYINPLGNTVSYSYNDRNRLISVKDPLNNTSSFTYDPSGNITEITFPGGRQITKTYDNIGRIISQQDAAGSLGVVAYDANSNVISYTNATGAITSATYDGLNRLKTVTDPLGNATTYNYDNNDNIISIVDRNGHTTSYTYDSSDRVKTYTDRNGYIINVAYDVAGNISSLKDQNNNITTYTYDLLNRLKTTTYPNGKFIQLNYDEKDNVLSKKLADGTTILFQYDTLNRPVVKTLPDGTIYNYTYDSFGRMISAGNNNGTVYITYDALNRVTGETFNNHTTHYTYDLAGRKQTIIYPDSTVILKSYDTRNRLSSISVNNAVVVTYGYNNADQLIAQNYTNGISTSRQYDFANRLSSILTASGTIQNTAFSYDNERNKTAISRSTDPSLSEQINYDNNYRITDYTRGGSVIHNMYSYDAAGNRTTVNSNGSINTYSVNNLNQITGISGNVNLNFTYDNNGNLSYDGISYKSYDAEGRLLKDSVSPSFKSVYKYDAFGRRISKTVNGVSSNYYYSGLSQIEHRDANTDSLLNKTVFGTFIFPVVTIRNDKNYFYHQNELNSVEAISTGSGRLLESYRYDIFGKTEIYDSANNIITASAAGNRFAYTGQEYDPETKSYHFHYRNYSPTTGSFEQRDPLGYADEMALYQYVGNNPANGIDMFGLEPCPPTAWDNTTKKASSMGNWISVLNYLSTIQREAGKFNTEGKSLTDRSTKFAKFNFAQQAANLTIGVNSLINDAPHLSEREFEIRAGELEHSVAQLAADITVAKNPLNPAAQAFSKTTALTGALDGLSQELTGSSLSRHYKNLDAPSIKVANRWLEQAEQRYKMDAKRIDAWKKIFGPDMDKWDEEMRNTYERHQKAAKQYVTTNLDANIPGYDPNCPPNNGNGGTLKNNPKGPGTTKPVIAVGPKDPNAIIGPDGQPTKHWVSVHDRLPYTILYENDKTASAPAKFVRVTSPVEPKQDAATFQLGNFGFNNQTFTVPTNTASYYQRLDCRDSLGLYVDITAGYDQVNNVAFWEFQSIDPITLLPPADPLKGFLLLQDSTKPFYGHGFVNFSVKPIQTSITLDTIGARAAIVFDFNDTIATNIHTNTIDAFAPTSHMNTISSNSTNPITLSWAGTDDTGGCGIDYYTIYVSTDQVSYSVLIPRISRTDTTLILPQDSSYCFFVLATDRVGNKETLRQDEIKCTYVGPPLPVTWLYFRGKTVVKDNILDWATANEQNSKQFDVERSLNGTTYSRIGIVNALGNSNQANSYQYTDHNIDRLNSETMFYRLKQIDIDGKFKYSNVVRLRYSEKNTVNSIVYPNPTTNGFVTILVGDNSLVGTVAVLFDINGRILENIKITANSQPVNLGKYVNGTYFIRLNNNEVLKIIKL